MMRAQPSRLRSLLIIPALTLAIASAACGEQPPPVAADEPAVLADYLAITELVADAVTAHPTDRAAAGAALSALYEAHGAAWAKTVARMRALYLDDLARDPGERMPNRRAELIARLEAAAKRITPHVKGEPAVLHDEAARKVLAAVAISDDYAELIRNKWQESGPGATP